MFFSLQTVVIVNTEQRVVLEITWRSNQWSVIRLHQWHSVTCGDMWWPRGSSDHSDVSPVSPDETRPRWLSAVMLEWAQTTDQAPQVRTLSGSLSPSSLSLSPVISCHWYGTKWWPSLWFSKLAQDYLKHNLRQSWTKRSLPVWSPMNCLGIYLCTVWDEYCAIGIGCRVY